MNGHRLNYEALLYLIAFSLALIMRFAFLGDPTMNDAEAQLALQSHGIIKNGSLVITAPPSYLAPTTLLFFLFGSSTFLARMFPAVVGSLLCFFPYFLKGRIGVVTSLISAFYLALDPFLIHLSKIANPEIIGITCFLFFCIAILSKNSILAGILFAGWILSGSSALPLLINILIALGFFLVIERKPIKSAINHIFESLVWKNGIISFWITFFVLGTIFFIKPFALSGWLSGVAEIVKGWSIQSSSTIPTNIFQVIMASAIFSILGIILGIPAMLRGLLNRDAVLSFIFYWWLIAIIFIFLDPSRQVSDLAWSTIPLGIAAARQISDKVRIPQGHSWVTALYTIFCLLLFFFVWLKLINLLILEPGSTDHQLAMVAIFGTLILVGATYVLIGWGWSWQVAKFALSTSLLIILMVYSFGMSRQAANFDWREQRDLLSSSPHIHEAGILLSTIEDISLQNSGIKDDVDITVLNYEKPSLVWLLRDFKNVDFSISLSAKETPSLVITGNQNVLQAPAEYRGQDFSWSVTTPWSLLTTKEWLRWLVFGDAILEKETIILWARNDLFPLYLPSDPEPAP